MKVNNYSCLHFNYFIFIIHIETLNFDINGTTTLPLSPSTNNDPTFIATSGSNVECSSQNTLAHSLTVPDKQLPKINQGQGIIYVTNIVML